MGPLRAGQSLRDGYTPLVGAPVGCDEMFSAVLAKVAFDSCLQEIRLLFVGTDDEDGVVPGDGSYDLGPILVVDARGDGLSASGSGDEDEEIDSLADFEAKAFEHLADSGEGVFVGVVAVGKRVAGWTFI
jgi:hypothetical protein